MKQIAWLVEKKNGLIIFVPFLCYLLLKIDLFNHHIVALVLGFIGSLITNLCRFPLGFSKIEDYPFHLLNIFFSFLLSLAFVLIKYVMTKFVILSPYSFLFYNGLFNIINSFLYILLEYFVVERLPFYPKDDDYTGNYFAENYLGIFRLLKGQELKFYQYLFFIFVLLFAYYIIIALTFFNFSPYLIIIVETCLPIDTDMIEILYKRDEVFNQGSIPTRILFQCIGYIFIVIAALILNETLILNFLGLNKNIRLNISTRSRLDVDGLFEHEVEADLDEINTNETNSEKS